MDGQTDLTSRSARIGVSEVAFFADFDLTCSGDQTVERDVVLIRTSVDVVLVSWLAEGSAVRMRELAFGRRNQARGHPPAIFGSLKARKGSPLS